MTDRKQRFKLHVHDQGYTGYPLKLHFQIPCFFPVRRQIFPVRRQIFPVPIYVICDYYIHKTDLADLSSLKKNGGFSRQISKYLLPLESGNLKLEQTKFPVFSMCFGKISKFPVFSLTGIFLGHFPCFPCAVGTLLYKIYWTSLQL